MSKPARNAKAKPQPAKPEAIRLRGVRQNNLKNLDLDIPLGQLIVVTGLSGSGKSSLVFDTVHAEGQRRYVETFSPYTRQFLEMLPRPQVDSVENVRPSIALEQGNTVKTSRSSVGTITELCDYFKVWFASESTLIDPATGEALSNHTPASIAKDALERFSGKTLLLCAAMPRPSSLPWEHVLAPLVKQGFTRAIIDGKVERLDSAEAGSENAHLPTNAETLTVVIDRVQAEPNAEATARFIEAATTALRLGQGFLEIYEQKDNRHATHLHRATEGLRSPKTGEKFAAAVPNLFSYNSPLGACPRCRGFGRIIEIDKNLIIPDPSKSLDEGAIAAFNGEVFKHSLNDLKRTSKPLGIPFDVPYEKLSQAHKDFIWQGDPQWDPKDSDWDSRWYGIDGFFRWIETQMYKMHMRVFISKFRSYTPCPDCEGTRLTNSANHWRWHGHRLADLYRMPVSDLLPLLKQHAVAELDARNLSASHPARLALHGILTRLGYLDAVGLGYLHLDRSSRTLSGGESQRVNLTACLGTSLVETLFVLDEPSIGLHARDVDRLIEILRTLRDQGNTVLVVEHDESVIRSADHVIEIGPQAGSGGGQIVYNGSGSALEDAPASLTGEYISGRKTIAAPLTLRPVDKKTPSLRLKGVSLHNLDKLDIEIPLGRFVALSGVSGSGKSTLLKYALHAGLLRERGQAVEIAAQISQVRGLEQIGEIVLVDQSPMSRTPRSNAAIMTGMWTRVRELYASTEAAQQAGMSISHFSFNHESGRCDHCEGLGYVEVSMQFLSDIYTPCPVCEGKRFKPEVLEIRWNEKSVSDLLAMTANEAITFFAGEKKIVAALNALLQTGLGYLPLGQPVNSLSGGESQRLKLVKFIGGLKKKELPALILLDEPTTGLHRDDVGRLLTLLQTLVDAGHSLVVIEHQQDVLKSADWLLELGPESGAHGGKLTFSGTPAQLASLENTQSATAPYLRAALGIQQNPKTQAARSTASKPLPAVTAHSHAHSRTALEIRGAREHNLKNINATIPHRQLTVVTGVSGSGKSTLAFDIVFAEGQRRFLESMSSYARQFVEQLSRPQVDSVSGIAPTVAIEQRVTHGTRKSTVATITEVAQYLRLLYARVGTQYSPQSLQPVVSLSPDALRKHLETHLASAACQKADAVYLCAPLIRSRKGHHEPLANWARAHDYRFLRCDGELVALENFKKLDRYKEHSIELALPLRPSSKEPLPRGSALQAILAEALRLGKGSCFILAVNSSSGAKKTATKGRIKTSAGSNNDAAGDVLGWLSTERTDPVSGEAFPELDPKHFSWNSLQGWCPTCRGYGTLEDWMLEREEFAHLKALKPLALGHACPDCAGSRLNRIARSVRIPLKASWGETRAATATPGATTTTAATEKKTTLGMALASRLAVADTLSLGELLALPSSLVLAALRQLKLNAHQKIIAQAIIPEIEERLRFMDEVGLGYLGLDRATNTLSGGEAQRIRLAAQLGSQLSGVLYVLDEPSIGLHARDNAALIGTLHRLRDKGNTLLVVEHDDDTMRAADQIIDLGPGAGIHGGEILANGSYRSLLANKQSLTGRFLRDGIRHPLRGSYRDVSAVAESATTLAQPTSAKAKTAPKGKQRKATATEAAPQWLSLTAPRLRNLRGDDLHLPLGRLSVICGPSGAGKSTLINDLLHPALQEVLAAAKTQKVLLWEKLPATSALRKLAASSAAHSAAVTNTPPSSSVNTSQSATRAKTAKKTASAQNNALPAALFTSLSGAESLHAVIAVDQSPIGKTPRSTPATYIGAWDIIRGIFAEAPEAKWRGFSAGTFSFNTAGGRCEHCQGAGRIKLEMAFLPEAYEVCPHCEGLRFGPDVLGITWRGKTIADVLEMSVEDAAAFFESHSRLHALLTLMAETGLGYLRLGQSSPTLSGGEAQRLKLVRELALGLPSWKDQRRGTSRNNIYLLEEPTIGLHLSDCLRLIELLQRLVDQGHTVVVIEHHLDLIAEADYVVEIGPNGGENGGHILYQGALAGLLTCKTSPTAPFLCTKL